MQKIVSFLIVTVFLGSTAASSASQCPKNSVRRNGVTKKQITEIVMNHNFYRLQVAKGTVLLQPKAANMLKLSWDDDLARAAQEQVDKCFFANDVDDPRFRVGVNYYTSMSTFYNPAANWTEAVKAWFNQLFATHYSFGSRNFNSYTQVVWAKTRKIGCGYMNFLEDSWYNKLYLCYYGPSGNLHDSVPYKIGSGCETLCKFEG